MSVIKLPAMPQPDGLMSDKNGDNAALVWSKEKLQSYARAAVESDRAQRVPDGWVQVTQHLLNSQEPWLYNPCWLAFPSGAVLRGVYEWRQGRNPDRFISDEVGDVWAFDVSHVMPVSTPPHPSKALLASTPAPAQQEPVNAVAYLDIGAGGYMDLGTDMSDEVLSQLQKGRHMLVIAGTYGVDGYTAAQHQEPPQQERKNCWCQTCRPITMNDMRMVLCPECGNKRCPKANDHRNACTNSNDPGQPGSAY